MRSDDPSNQSQFPAVFHGGMSSVGLFTEAKLQEHFIYKAAAEYVAKAR
jgi:hypothetical protein